MSFAEKFEAGRRELHKAQRERALALVTGLLAAFTAAVLAWYVLDALNQPGRADDILTLGWAIGAMVGAGSLLYYGSVSTPSKLADQLAYTGLWVGDVTISATIAVMPLAIFLGSLFVAGGYLFVRRRGRGIAIAYAALPFIALVVSIAVSNVVDLAFG